MKNLAQFLQVETQMQYGALLTIVVERERNNIVYLYYYIIVATANSTTILPVQLGSNY